MADQEPTPWELLRILTAVQETLARMEGRILTVPVFEAHQQALNQRFADIDRRHTEWTVESRGAHVALDAEIEAVKAMVATRVDAIKVTVATNAETSRDRQDKFEERLRTDRQKWQLTGAGATLGLIGSFVMWLLNGGPS